MTNLTKSKRTARFLRHGRVRARIKGTETRPRLSVFRSLSQIYVQLIDDEAGRTLVAASSKEIKSKAAKTEVAAEVGKLIGKKALASGIKKVVFDRGGNKYHGRIKSLAEAARRAGLEF